MEAKAYLVATTYLENGNIRVKIGIFSERNPSSDINRLIKQTVIHQTSAPTFDEARLKLFELIEFDMDKPDTLIDRVGPS